MHPDWQNLPRHNPQHEYYGIMVGFYFPEYQENLWSTFEKLEDAIILMNYWQQYDFDFVSMITSWKR